MTAQTGKANGPAPALDEELLLWPGDEPLAVRAADAERICEIAGELARGFVRLATIGPAVTIFGSVRTPQDHANYRLMRQVGAAVGAAGYAVITGRGPRLMEAANPGEPEMWERCRWDAVSSCPTWKAVTIIWTSAFASGTSSRARSCSSATPAHSSLAREDSGRSTSCSALTLIQTRTIKDLPVIPVGEGEWDELSDWLRERVLADRRIDSDDLAGLYVVGHPVKIVSAAHQGQLAQAHEPTRRA